MNLKELTAYALNTFLPKTQLTSADIKSVEKNESSSFSVIIYLNNGRTVNMNGSTACKILEKIKEEKLNF